MDPPVVFFVRAWARGTESDGRARGRGVPEGRDAVDETNRAQRSGFFP
jgi:hypothetical protein